MAGHRRDATGEGAHIRFSDDLDRDRDRPSSQTPPAPPRQTATTTSLDLYTIESHAEPPPAPQPRPDAPRRAGMSPEDPRQQQQRRSVVSWADREPSISLARPRHFGGFDGASSAGGKAAAAETGHTLAHYRDWVARNRETRRRWARGPLGRVRARAGELYRRVVVEGLLRQRPLPPSRDGRHIPLSASRERLVDERRGKAYVDNFIRSSRYTVWDFVPKQLVFQFSKLANFYFLCVAIAQLIPGLSTTGTFTTGAPLLVFVAVSMAKEGYDDYRRYKLDLTENRSTVLVFDPQKEIEQKQERKRRKGLKDRSGKKKAENVGNEMNMAELEAGRGPGPGQTEKEADPWTAIEWQDVRVGDVLQLRRDEQVPADLILLSASGLNGVAYIDTMALDGETNLKSKQASPLLAEHCGNAAQLAQLNSAHAVVVSEDPNLDLYSYEGRAVVAGKTTPLTMNQIVFRGSTLRNTVSAVGLVVNSGEECKIRMNAHNNVHAKAPAMQGIVNRIVLLLVIFVVLLACGCTLGNQLWVRRYERIAWYLRGADVPFAHIIFGFIIMFNTLIPLSLYISLEIIKIGQLVLMQDVEMYDAETDMPMVANTTTILENLGQVSYIFSDKTGTLTENKMRFRKMSVAGTAWLHDMDVVRDAEERAQRERKRRLSQRKGAGGKGKKRLEHHREPSKRSSRNMAGPGEPMAAPLIDGPADVGAGTTLPSRHMSQWKSTARPTAAQPELKTEDLIRYIRQRPNTSFSRKARHFILCLALCHTCLPETKEDGEIEFQAASPDELALVQAARDLGYLLIDRPAQTIKLQFTDVDGSLVTEAYEVLDVIEFSSKRKRMSIVVRMPDGRICLFSKGADSVILPRLKQNQMAIQKASAVERRASMRKSVEQEKALRRRSTHGTPRESINLARASMSHVRNSMRRNSTRKSTEATSAAAATARRRSSAFVDGVDEWLRQREMEDMDGAAEGDIDAYTSPRNSIARPTSCGVVASPGDDSLDGLVDESLANNDSAVFDRCFQHIDDFASEGLRTLLFAYRYLDEDDYTKWKTLYHDAETSLANRQDRIEAAADLIEQSFDLAGATAIEDKLQQGVPETIDKLRRANIRIWMLTGDKRETAINIAHSARICKPFSELYVLDASEGAGLQERIAAALVDVGRGLTPHSVVVIDGQTLAAVEADEEMKILFLDLVARVDSVICCRAAPAQKAALVKHIRAHVRGSMTLAIGDGANDIAMIQASHVGVGISGREGLQAARIADFSIAQFRFLQRLLLVHGRWNYVRTGKYILATFWKEMVFFLVQAQYQHYNGYTGTSLYESWSLTVFNTLFTSLPVILLGIFEKDLCAATLLAVPELYSSMGQRGRGFSVRQYFGWMAMAVCEAVLIYNVIYGIYSVSVFSIDTSLFAMGTLAFTVSVLFINLKMLVLELHNQTVISFLGLFISISGWFVWNLFISAVYADKPGPYMVRGTFTRNFGRSPIWWLTGVVTLAAVLVLELLATGVRRVYRPHDVDLMQEVEQQDGVLGVLREHAAEEGKAGGTAKGKGRAGEAVRHDGHEGDADDAASVQTLQTSAASEASGAVPGLDGLVEAPAAHRRSRVLDDYVPPPFTPPAEGDEARSARGWLGATGGGSSVSRRGDTVEFAQSPIELQAPPGRRRWGA